MEGAVTDLRAFSGVFYFVVLLLRPLSVQMWEAVKASASRGWPIAWILHARAPAATLACQVHGAAAIAS